MIDHSKQEQNRLNQVCYLGTYHTFISNRSVSLNMIKSSLQAIAVECNVVYSVEGLKPRGVPKNAEWSIGRHDAPSPLVIITGTSTLNESKSDQADPMDAWELHIEMELIGAMEQRIEV